MYTLSNSIPKRQLKEMRKAEVEKKKEEKNNKKQEGKKTLAQKKGKK